MHDYNTILGVIELRLSKVSYDSVQKRYRIGRSGIALIMNRYKDSGLSLDDLRQMPASKVVDLIYPKENLRHKDIPLPDFEKIHEQMIQMGKHADLSFLWIDYKKEHPNGYQLAQFYKLYRDFMVDTYGTSKTSMPVERIPGEKMYIDWVGDQPELLLDTTTGELRKVHIFTTTLGFSSLVYAEIFLDEKLPQISRTTLANWIIYCSQNYFQPMYDYFHRELLKRSFAMADETRVQVLKEEGRRAQTQSFMWLFRSGEDGLAEIILYGYSPTRSGSHAKEFLEGYSGYLETDGYQGYNNLPGIRRCSCWAHIRRYFIDAVPQGKQYDYSQPAVQGVQYCNRLFAIEDSINKKYPGNYEKRKQLRLEKEKPVLEAFWSWLDQQKPVRNTRLDKAVNYVLNRRDIAETYLEDGRCSFTNNLSENAIRPFAVGRKNWLFSSSVDGANASAVVYTMVEMAKAHGLNIYGYLKFLLEHRPSKNMTDEQLAELAPWSEKLQSIKNRM